MRKSEEAVAWVVYKMAVAKKPDGMNAVCEQAVKEQLTALTGYSEQYMTSLTKLLASDLAGWQP